MKDALIHFWGGSGVKMIIRVTKNDYNVFFTWLKGLNWSKKGALNILLICLTVLKLIIKGKDSKMKGKNWGKEDILL